MRKALSKSLLVMAAASGILTAAGGYAFADASADGAAIGSPGVGSGNNVQVPVHVPVNLCGNTVNVIGLLNPAFGNECVNKGGSGTGGQGASAEGGAVGSPGVLSGNNVQVPVDVPVNVCGNTVDVIGALNPAFGNKCGNESGGHETPPPPVHPPHKPPVHPPHKPPVHPPHKPPVHPPHKPPTTHKPPHHHHPDCPPTHHKPPTHHQPPTHHKPPTHHQHPWHHQHPNHHRPATHHKPPQLAHTGADANLGMAGGAAAAMVLGGTLLVRRTRASKD
ncbi:MULTISPECIES: chaplin [unclassified Streptomyces]|uniref:chaplin n=1 Tax=unclassified Streptomyces TaxID=2593676 RepID=UPI00372116B7